MNLDMNKINKLVSSKSLAKDSLTEEEYDFIRMIYNTIIDSEDYEISTKMLSIIYDMKESEVKYLKNVYYSFLATKEEKKAYLYVRNELMNKNKKSRGFANISIIISLLILLITFGIYLGYILYNLI